MTKKEAIAIYDSGIWKDWTAREIALCQLYEERLIVPFDVFKQAMNDVMGRSVSTHEYSAANAEKLQAEFEDKLAPATLADSIASLRAQLNASLFSKN